MKMPKMSVKYTLFTNCHILVIFEISTKLVLKKNLCSQRPILNNMSHYVHDVIFSTECH